MEKRINKLIEMVKYYHRNQKRKYTEEPYFVHPESVANIVSGFVDKYPLIIEVAYCHDLIEDTEMTSTLLYNELLSFGYSELEAELITDCTNELSDEFTKENYPNLNRKKRKELEADRLSRVSPLSQTVKYADMIDNTTTIVELDPGFSVIYLKEKKLFVNKMINGERKLRDIILKSLE
jgi:(p)ppGpp synthase/HD superfamily hydrolase